jgi:hypothetical protein
MQNIYRIGFIVGVILVTWAFLRPSAVGQPPVNQDVATGRWQVCQAALAAEDKGGGRSFNTANTILLDSVTGDTWLLWTSEKQQPGYVWVPLGKGEGRRLDDQLPH